MTNFTFRVGIPFELDGANCKIERFLVDGISVQVENLATGQSLPKLFTDLVNAYAEGRLKFATVSKDTDDSAKIGKWRTRVERSVAQLPDKDRVVIERRRSYLREIERRGIEALTPAALKNQLIQIAQERGDARPPSASSIRRWRDAFRESGNNPRALLNDYSACGKSSNKLPALVYTLVEQAIQERFLTREKASVKGVHERLLALIDGHNRRVPADQKLPAAPSDRIVRKMIGELSAYDVSVAHIGKKAADMKFRAVTGSIAATRPLELALMDHTPTDLFVVMEETGLPLGRAWVTVLIDAYSRHVLGFYIGFEPPSNHSVLACFKHAFLPKAYLKEKNPSIESTWDCYGIPDQIVTDNDVTHHGKTVEDVCFELDVQLGFNPVKMPWLKGHVERFFGTLNGTLLHATRGTTFSNIFDRGDYNPMKNAVVTFRSLVKGFEKWIVDVYGQSPNRTLGDTPAHRWSIGAAAHPPRLVPSADMLDAILGVSKTRVLGHEGIEHESIFYNSAACTTLRKRMGDRITVDIKVDPSDLGRIHVLDAETGKWFPVPVREQFRDYATGLTTFQHDVLRKYARDQLKGTVNSVALALAKERVREIMLSELGRGPRNRSRQKVGRMLGQGSDRMDQRDFLATIDAENGMALKGLVAVTEPLVDKATDATNAIPSAFGVGDLIDEGFRSLEENAFQRDERKVREGLCSEPSDAGHTAAPGPTKEGKTEGKTSNRKVSQALPKRTPPVVDLPEIEADYSLPTN